MGRLDGVRPTEAGWDAYRSAFTTAERRKLATGQMLTYVCTQSHTTRPQSLKRCLAYVIL